MESADWLHNVYRIAENREASLRDSPTVYGLNPRKLALAGFYYVGPQDKIRCFECGLTLDGEDIDDDVEVLHQRWAGKCRYLRKLPCGNVPLGADPKAIPDVGRDVTGLYELEYRDVVEEHRPPLYPHLSNSKEKRLHTFAHEFSVHAGRLVTSQQLAEAGFFKCLSKIMCAYCGTTYSSAMHPKLNHAPACMYRKEPSPKIKNKCSFCEYGELEICVQPCGHVALCKACVAITDNKCTLCKVPITSYVIVKFS